MKLLNKIVLAASIFVAGASSTLAADANPDTLKVALLPDETRQS